MPKDMKMKTKSMGMKKMGMGASYGPPMPSLAGKTLPPVKTTGNTISS